MCHCAYQHPVHAYPVAGPFNLHTGLVWQSKYRRQKQNKKTEINDLKEKMLRQDELLGEKDQANSSLRTEITQQTEMIEQLKKENEDLQSKNEKFEVDKQ